MDKTPTLFEWAAPNAQMPTPRPQADRGPAGLRTKRGMIIHGTHH
jgi:hypothetical protein